MGIALGPGQAVGVGDCSGVGLGKVSILTGRSRTENERVRLLTHVQSAKHISPEEEVEICLGWAANTAESAIPNRFGSIANHSLLKT